MMVWQYTKHQDECAGWGKPKWVAIRTPPSPPKFNQPSLDTRYQVLVLYLPASKRSKRLQQYLTNLKERYIETQESPAGKDMSINFILTRTPGTRRAPQDLSII